MAGDKSPQRQMDAAGNYADYDDYAREYMRKAAKNIPETAVLPTAQETEFIPD